MQAAFIEVKRENGQVVVLAIGRTGRGQRFIKDRVVLGVKSLADKDFKAQMAEAVDRMLGSEVPDIQYGLNIDRRED